MGWFLSSLVLISIIKKNAADWTDQWRWDVDATFAVSSLKFHLRCHIFCILGSISDLAKKAYNMNWFTDLVTDSNRKSWTCFYSKHQNQKSSWKKKFPPCSCQSVCFLTVSGCKIWNKARAIVCGWVISAVRSSALFLQTFPGSCWPAHTLLYLEAVRCLCWIPSAEPRLSGRSWAARHTQTLPSDPGTYTDRDTHTHIHTICLHFNLLKILFFYLLRDSSNLDYPHIPLWNWVSLINMLLWHQK